MRASSLISSVNAAATGLLPKQQHRSPVVPSTAKAYRPCSLLIKPSSLPRSAHRGPVAFPGVALPSRSLSRTAVVVAASSAAAEPAATRPALSKKGFHVHFGGGKLGMGLVFNALVASEVPFAVMQPPFPGDCDVLLKDETVDIVINGEDRLPGGLSVVTADNFKAVKDRMKKDRSIVLIHPGPEWDEIVRNATSFSCSIGPKVVDVIGPLLTSNTKQVPLELRPKLFACENDHNAVEKLKELLKGRVEVVPCMVDRICSGREVLPGSMSITTEPWAGTIVPLTPQPDACDDCEKPFPLGGSNVFVPKTERQSNYMYERKIMTVNHMHTTLAFLSLVQHMEDNGLKPEQMVAGPSACMSLPLVKYDPGRNPRTNTIWCWGVAQCLLLESEHDRNTMLKAHKASSSEELNADVLRTVRENLDRFAAVEDSTARVLGAGVDLRYQGRLLPAFESVKVLQGLLAEWPEDNRYKQLLDAAGVTIDDVVDACQYLVMAAEPIAEADREKYSLEKAEAEPFYRRILSSSRDAVGGAAEGPTLSEIISDEIEVMEQGVGRVLDLGLDWVACRLQDLGFSSIGSWERSVNMANSISIYEDPCSSPNASDSDIVAQQATEMAPDWLTSFEEKKRREKAS